MSLPTLAIRVISLPDSAERRAAVRETLSGLTLPWAFVDARRGDAPSDLAEDPAAQRDSFGRALTAGETGVFKSHMAVLAEFEADPALDWLLVLEDDVWIDIAFPYAELASFLDEKGIGFLRLFCREWKPAYPRYRFGERQILFLTSDPYGTQGYLISRHMAAHLRRHVTAILRPIDDELGRFWENGLDNHLLFPFPVLERHTPSTIEAGRAASLREKRADTMRRLGAKLSDYIAKKAYLAWRRSPFARDRIRPRRR